MHSSVSIPNTRQDPGTRMREDDQTQPYNKDQFSSQANTHHTGRTGQLICEAQAARLSQVRFVRVPDLQDVMSRMVEVEAPRS